MANYSIPYAVTAYDRAMDPATRPNLTALLWTPSGAPRFGGFVMYPNIEAAGYLNRSEVEAIWDFQHRSRARSVKFFAWPTYFGFKPDYSQCSSSGDSPAMEPGLATTTGGGALGIGAHALTFVGGSPFGLEGAQLTPVVSSDGLYRCPGIRSAPLPTCSIWGPGSDFEVGGLHPNCTSTPFMELSARGGGGGGGLAAMIVDYTDDGRESMGFTFDCAMWSPTCMVLGRLSVAWLLQRDRTSPGAAAAAPAAPGDAVAGEPDAFWGGGGGAGGSPGTTPFPTGSTGGGTGAAAATSDAGAPAIVQSEAAPQIVPDLLTAAA
ncbi:MAG: hypothetical protein J3K34DRAFT_516331 [Monoraphidium minutum]|nr:MAG: hypothetical protein J3K34DRAFT_516331 [Monoraphidium minutum]